MSTYLDASFVLELIEPLAPRHDDARQRFATLRAGEVCGSRLLVTEGLVRSLRDHNDLKIARFWGLYARLTELAMSDPVFFTAAQLRAQHGLKSPDALHLGCALVHGCDEFWTHDERLARLNGQLALTVVT